ncbi:magnesium transporter CorA family protein, partial [Candidatus Latescibacterota bacterium]
SYMAAVSSTIDAYMSLSSHRMNSVMKTLTVIATLVLIPTLVTSIYGMNVPLPFQENPHSFLIVIAITVFFAGGMLMFFKKKDWF